MNDNNEPSVTLDLRNRIKQVTELPAMPGLAQEIFRLKSNPYAELRDLVKVIETDPSLAAQVMRYAKSALFGFNGRITSVQEAITFVLGFDMTINIALGLSLGKYFRNPLSGPVGLSAFWRHAIYSAALTQRLGLAISYEQRPPPGLSYLCGLLHNFGFLILGHLFPKELLQLNEIIKNHPDEPVLEIERRTIGITHAEIGSWIMQAWKLPKEIQVVAAEHHNARYGGEYAVYVHLVLLTDRLLKRHGIGDAEDTTLPEDIMQSLHLTEDKLIMETDKILEGSSDLDVMVQQMAA